MNLKKFLLTFLISLIIFLLGIIFYSDLINILLPDIDAVSYAWMGMSDQFRDALFFGTTLSIVPFGLQFVWIKNKPFSKLAKLISVLILIFFILLSLALSYFILYNNLELRGVLIRSTAINVSVDLSEIQYWLYVLCGILVGLLVNYFYFKKNKP